MRVRRWFAIAPLCLAYFPTRYLFVAWIGFPESYDPTKNNMFGFKLPILHSTKVSVIRKLVRFTASACQVADAKCFLLCGTLLGQVREHGKVLAFDNDGDVGLLNDDLARLREAWDDGRITEYANKRREFDGFSIDFRKFPDDSPLGIVARAFDTQTELYVDIFLFFTDNVPQASAVGKDVLCGANRTLAPRPPLNIYPHWPDINPRNMATKCGGIRGSWSHAWEGCESCLTRKDNIHRKLLRVPATFIYPLHTCLMEGMEMLCPNKPLELLTYLFGSGWRTPPWEHRPVIIRLNTILLILLLCVALWCGVCKKLKQHHDYNRVPTSETHSVSTSHSPSSFHTDLT